MAIATPFRRDITAAAATSITGSEPLMRDASRPPRVPLHLQSYDGTLGRQVIDLHVWAVDQGLRGAAADALWDGFCQRLVIAGVPLWRAPARAPTLLPPKGAVLCTLPRPPHPPAP